MYPAAKMKAVRFHEYGGPEVLRTEEVERPEPGQGEVLVRVHAAGVNPVDAKLRSGSMQKLLPLKLPHVAGLDFSGTVEKVGARVVKFAPDEAVFGRVPLGGAQGSYAEYVVAGIEDIALKPLGVDFQHAAALPTPGLAAWQGLFTSGGQVTMGLQRGQTVLIHGAAGGVGTIAVQLARWKGARVVATCATEHVEYVKGLGADTVIDYRTTRFEAVAGEVDAVLDLVGGETQARSWALLKRGGVLVSSVGVQGKEQAEAAGVRAVSLMAGQDDRVLTTLIDLVDERVVRLRISSLRPIDDAVEAHRQIETGHTQGKIVLELGKPPF